MQEEVKSKPDAETSTTIPSRVVRLCDCHLKTQTEKFISIILPFIYLFIFFWL